MGLFDLFGELKFSINQIKGQNIICISAIASPKSFVNILQDMGAKIVKKVILADHYYFSREELNKYLNWAIKYNAIIVTTEKDIVKIRRISDDKKIYYLEIEVDFISGEKELCEKIQKLL